jgi:NTP pyrophosphatase (non-canonical NTP hydrolase)
MRRLSFDDLSAANWNRLVLTPKYRVCVEEWVASDWSNALAGETGEFCNLVKKVRVGENIDTEALAKELADVVIYADLCAQHFGIDLGEAVTRKFNEVSLRVGSEERL